MSKRAIGRRFFIFGPDVRGRTKGHGLVFENQDNLKTPPRLVVRPAEGGFPNFSEMPRIAYVKKEGHPPRDIEDGMSGYWFVSERLKDAFQAVDPEGFLFADCDYVLPDGSKGPKHFLCDVVRTIDALDEAKSAVQLRTFHDHKEGIDVQRYSIAGGGRLVFDPDRVEAGHVFFQSRLPGNPICDDLLYDKCRNIPELKGIRFRDALKL